MLIDWRKFAAAPLAMPVDIKLGRQFTRGKYDFDVNVGSTPRVGDRFERAKPIGAIRPGREMAKSLKRVVTTDLAAVSGVHIAAVDITLPNLNACT